MIHNLVGAGSLQRDADVVVIGGGTVGLLMATRLARKGVKVVCLESGGREQADDTHPLNSVEQFGSGYAGAEQGRFRCLGGTSTRWGGALIPFQASDLRNADWPIDWDELAHWLPQVEELFHLAPGPYDDQEVPIGRDHLARLAKWPAFGKRNVYSLLNQDVEAKDGPEIWLNATATKFLTAGRRLVEIEALAVDGSRITVNAKEVVLAAGAIESTRILLLVDKQNAQRRQSTTLCLGEGFHDHLSAVVADVVPHHRAALNRLLGFRFADNGCMRSMRFELAANSPERDQVMPCFAHVGFSAPNGGFSALRDVLRSLQQRRLPSVSNMAGLATGMPWLMRAVFWRIVHKRLLYPSDAKLHLHMVIEQPPRRANCISLSERACDQFGNPIARICWNVGEEDVLQMRRAADCFERSWVNSPLASLAALRSRESDDIRSDMIGGGGIYHPGGTTRMARNAREGVVDPDLRVFGLENVSVCATSVLPTGGGANPTMMLMILAMRCVDRLAMSLTEGSLSMQYSLSDANRSSIGGRNKHV